MSLFTLKARSRGTSASSVLSHIARYAPSSEGNICVPITHFQCKNNFEHLLIFLRTKLAQKERSCKTNKCYFRTSCHKRTDFGRQNNTHCLTCCINNLSPSKFLNLKHLQTNKPNIYTPHIATLVLIDKRMFNNFVTKVWAIQIFSTNLQSK